MADVQRFKVAPMSVSSIFRFLETFPVIRIVLPVPFLMLALGASGLLIPGLRMPWGVAVLLCVAALLLPVLMVATAFVSRSASIEINGDHLIVRGAILGPSAHLQALRLSEARAVDLRSDPSYRPVTGGGFNVPGYIAGSGTVGRGEQVTWLLTDPSRVLYVPARSGRSLLISVESPDAIVETLRSMPVPADA